MSCQIQFNKMKSEGKILQPETYPVHMKYLPPKFVKKAEIELCETPKIKELRLQEVRSALSEDPDIKSEWFSDEDVIMYLRGRKYDAKQAVRAMKKMVAFIKKNPKFFEPVDRSKLEIMIKSDALRYLPRRDKDGNVIALAKLATWEPSIVSVEELMRCMCIMSFHALTYPMSQVNGAKAIYDFNGPFLKYLKHYTPFNAYAIYQLLFECVPFRIKSFHLLNPNGLSKIIMPIILPFASEKIRQRFKLHNQPSELLDHLDPCVVPCEYGGQLSESERNQLLDIDSIRLPDFVINIRNSLKSSGSR